MTFPVSLSSYCYSSSSIENQVLKFSPHGLIAISSGQDLIILSMINNKIYPFRTLSVHSQITSFEWCNGYNTCGEIPTLLLLASENGCVSIVDPINATCKAKFTIQNGYLKSAMWPPNDSNFFCFGDSSGDFHICQIDSSSSNGIKEIFTHSFKFSIDFINASQYLSNTYLIGSKNGNFSILKLNSKLDLAEHVHSGMFPVEESQIVQMEFYQNIPNSLLFVTQLAAHIFFVNENSLIPFYLGDDLHNPINKLLFPETESSIFIAVHKVSAYVLQFTNENLSKIQHLRVLLDSSYSSQSIISASQFGSKIAFLSYGGIVQIYENKRNRFYSTHFYTNLSANTTAIDIYNSRIIFGTTKGYIYITGPPTGEINSNQISNVFSLISGPITQIFWVSEKSFIFTGFTKVKNQKMQKVIYYNIETRSQKSLLKPIMEFSLTPAQLIITNDRSCFAIIIDSISILLMNSETCEEIGIISFDRPSIMATFSSSHELWVVDSFFTLSCISFSNFLTSNDNTKNIPNNFIKSNMKIQLDDKISKLEKPTCINVLSHFLIFGTASGTIVLFDWEKTITKVLKLSDLTNASSMILMNSIIDIIVSPDHIHAIVINSKGACVLLTVNETQLEINSLENNILQINTKYPNCKLALWFSPDDLLAKFKNSTSWSLVSPSFTFKQAPLASIHNNFNLLKDENDRRRLTIVQGSNKSFDECSIIAKEQYIHLLFKLLSASKNSLTQVDAINYFKFIQNLINGVNFEELRELKIRLNLILGENDKAFEKLITTPSSSPNFVAYVLKAALVHQLPNKASNSSLVVAALMEGDQTSDAIDLLLISGQIKEAVKLMLTKGLVQIGLMIARAKMNDEDFEQTLELVEDTMKKNGQLIEAATLLMKFHKYKKAALLIKEKYPFVSDYIEAFDSDEILSIEKLSVYSQ